MNTNTITNDGYPVGKWGLRACLVTTKLCISAVAAVFESVVIRKSCNGIPKKTQDQLLFGLFVGNYKALNLLENKITDKIFDKSDSLEQSINSESEEKLTLGKFALKTGLVVTKLAISGVVGGFISGNFYKKINANNSANDILTLAKNRLLTLVLSFGSSFATYEALNWLENKITDKITGKSDSLKQSAIDASTIAAEDGVEAAGVASPYEVAESL